MKTTRYTPTILVFLVSVVLCILGCGKERTIRKATSKAEIVYRNEDHTSSDKPWVMGYIPMEFDEDGIEHPDVKIFRGPTSTCGGVEPLTVAQRNLEFNAWIERYSSSYHRSWQQAATVQCAASRDTAPCPSPVVPGTYPIFRMDDGTDPFRFTLVAGRPLPHGYRLYALCQAKAN